MRAQKWRTSSHILFQVLGEVEEDNYPDGSADNQEIHNFVYDEVPGEQRIEVRPSLCPDNEDVIEFYAEEAQKNHHNNQSLTVTVTLRNLLDETKLGQACNGQQVKEDDKQHCQKSVPKLDRQSSPLAHKCEHNKDWSQNHHRASLEKITLKLHANPSK